MKGWQSAGRFSLGYASQCKSVSENHGNVFKNGKNRDYLASFFLKLTLPVFFSSQKFNHGRYLSMTAVKGQRRSVNIVPENTFNAGSKDVTTNMAGFTSKRIAITNGKQNATTEGTYIEAFARSKWQINDKIQVIQSTGKAIKVEGTTYPLKSDLQRRCIVGRKIHQQIWKPNS